jgi:hypothetical protein
VLFTPVREIFDLQQLSVVDFLIAIGLSSIVFWAVEIEKLIKRLKNKTTTHEIRMENSL